MIKNKGKVTCPMCGSSSCKLGLSDFLKSTKNIKPKDKRPDLGYPVNNKKEEK